MGQKRRGRPCWEPSQKDRATVSAMIAAGISQDAICAVLKVDCVPFSSVRLFTPL